MSDDKVQAVWDRAAARQAREEAEAKRIEDVRASGFVPPDCGDMIPEAPARGPVRTFDPIARYPDGKDGYVLRPSGYRGRKALQVADQFDQVRVAAQRAKKPEPFTRRQEDAGRAYRDLFLDLQSRGFSQSSLTGVSGGGDGRDFMERYADDHAQLKLWQARIGHGCAMPVRRIRPSERGSKSGIMDRALVDQFCIFDKTISDILAAHGWAAKGKTRAALIAALGAALDRLSGPIQSGGIRRMGDGLTLSGLRKGIDS